VAGPVPADGIGVGALAGCAVVR